MILVPFGVSKVMKNKLPKLDLIMESLTGRSLDSLEPLIPVVSEEVRLLLFSLPKRGIFLIIVINKNIGFQVFSRNCGNCHGMIAKKYDLLLDKVYEQL
jgi:hypothetical protein